MEIQTSQSHVLGKLQLQQKNLENHEGFREVLETMACLPLYHSKLATIRKDMVSIAERTSKMKKRPQKLETKRHRLDSKNAKEREQERIREERLRARPSSTLVEADAEP